MDKIKQKLISALEIEKDTLDRYVIKCYDHFITIEYLKT